MVGSLSGTIRDAATHAPLAGATVTAAGVEGGTGSDGGYRLDSVPVGTHQGTVSREGYLTQTFEAEVQAGTTTTVTLELVPGGSAPLTITTSELPVATVDAPYELSLEATGGTPPYSWSAELPPGLALTSDGLISGTPDFPAGAYVVAIAVRDAASARVTADFGLEVRAPSGLRALGGQLPGGEEGVAYSESVGAEGGAPPYTFELGGLPTGLVVDPGTGAISGIPEEATGPNGEPAELELIVRDAVGASAFAPVSIGILPGPLVITSELPDGVVGLTYEGFFDHDGGFGTWDEYTVISGTLPPGLGVTGPESLYGSRLIGTPTLAGTFEFTIQLRLCVSPAEDCTLATKEYEVVIAASPLSIVTSSLPDADAGTPYSVFLVREGGAGPFTWDVVAGSLPVGISLTAEGELAGTPTAAGDASFEVRVRDAGSQSATAGLTLHVKP